MLMKILPFMKKGLSYNFRIWKMYDNHFFPKKETQLLFITTLF